MERGEELRIAPPDRRRRGRASSSASRNSGLSVSRLREVGQLADLVADHQLQIPQRMQKPAQERLIVGADRPLEQHQQIDVGMEPELPPAVAAEGEDGDRAGRRRRLEEEALEQRVDAIGVALGRGAAGGAAQRVLDQFLARGFERGRRG